MKKYALLCLSHISTEICHDAGNDVAIDIPFLQQVQFPANV